MPTIKDIALAAGVSHATVSNVLNKKGNVSSEKIRLVEATARALGYHIDEQASLLRKGTTRTVAVILPDIQSARYCDLYTGILHSLEQRGYSARLFLTENIPSRERNAINSAIAAKACGILTVTCLDSAGKCYQVPSLKETPVLFLERKSQKEEFPYFYFDYEQAGQTLAAKAKEKGLISPGVFTGNCYYSPNRDFLQGVQKVYPELNAKQIIDLKYGNRSTDAYTAFQQGITFDCCITSSPEIAGQLFSICQASGVASCPEFFTLSSLRTAREGRFHALSLNYSRLGIESAAALMDAAEKNIPIESRCFEASCYCPLYPPVLFHSEKPLQMLSLDSPTARALNCLLPEFTRQTGIAVKLETYPLSTIYNYIAAGKTLDYDVLRVDVSNFDFISPKLLTPLTKVDPGAERHLERFIPGLAQNYSYVDGTLYALPFDISIQMLFYRRDLFQDAMEMRSFFETTRHSLKVPETFEEYNETARFFTKSFRPESPTAYGTSISLGNPSSSSVEYLVRLLGMKEDSFDENGLLHISSPAAKKALENYLESAAYASPETIHSWGTVADQFVHGQLAMAILFVNHASQLIRTRNTLTSNQVGFAPVPGARPLLGGGTLGICASSRQKEQAYQLIQWATGEEIASRLMIMGGISPCRSAYENIEVLNVYPWLKDFAENLQMGSRKTIFSNQGIHLDIHKFETALGKLIIDAAKGKRQLDETIWRAQLLIEEIGEKDHE